MSFDLHHGDALEVLRQFEDGQVRCCVTSPPYFNLRDYGVEGQLGGEHRPEEYIERLVSVFREVRRLLTDDGTLWVNIGDSYARNFRKAGKERARHAGKQRYIYAEHLTTGSSDGLVGRSDRAAGAGVTPCKVKDLIGIPWMLAFALRADGWYLRQEIIWNKRNPLPESVEDRFTKAHEQVFLLSKSSDYFFDYQAVLEPAICGDRGSKFEEGKTAEHQLARMQKHRRKSEVADHRSNGVSMKALDDNPKKERRKRSVWTISVARYEGAHFAVMPEDLVHPCVFAGSAPGDIVLDPFCGSGTVGAVALQHGRNFVGVDLNQQYLELAHERLQGHVPTQEVA